MKVRVYQLDGQVLDVADVQNLLLFSSGVEIPPPLMEHRTLILITENILGLVTSPQPAVNP